MNLILGDCLERMREIPDGSVDIVVTDPPYGINYKDWDVLHNNTNRGLMGASPAQEKTAIFKSRGKPLNGWSNSDKSQGLQVQEWHKVWLEEIFRLTKPLSPILIMTGRQWQHRAVCAAEDVGFVFKDSLTWDKGAAPFRAQRVNCVLRGSGTLEVEDVYRLGNLAPRCEPIVWMFKPYKLGTTVTEHFLNSGLGCFSSKELTSNLISIPSKVVNKRHETQKPIELMELLISLVSQEGHCVLDPFMGSGTTGVACKNLHRKFIGIEKDEKYFEIAKARIEAA